MTEPLASIIVPYRNAAPTLKACVRSCFEQRHGKLEVVLVNNNSTDRGPELARELSRDAPVPLVLTDCRQPGVCAARNHGLRIAKGEYIQWLDADDALWPDKIQRQIRSLADAPGYDIAYCDWRWVFRLDPAAPRRHFSALLKTVRHVPPDPGLWTFNAGRNPVAFARMHTRQYDDYLLRLLENKWLPPHAYLLRRSAAEDLLENGVFSPKVTYGDDRHYFTVAAILGMRFRYVPGTGVDYHTWSPNQMTTGTPAQQRLANIQRIFEHLRSLAGEKRHVRLTPEHRFLLEQDNGRWSLAGELSTLRPGRDGEFVCTLPSGEVRLNLRELKVIKVLATQGGRKRLEIFAKIFAHAVPAYWERHTEIMRVLVRLTELGVLRRADPAS